MSFDQPLALVAAALVTALVALLVRWSARRRAAQALAYSNLAFALDALRAPRLPGAFLAAGTIAGSAALALALAGPHFVTRVPSRDATVVLCVDTSGSMRATDLRPTRAAASTAAARAFVDAVPAGTRVGLITFASVASEVLAPTADLTAVRDALDRVPAPDGATAIGDALELAARILPPRGRRAIVLLTDGVNNRGIEPLRAAQNVGGRGVRIETVGIGSAEGAGDVIPGTSDLAGLDVDVLRSVAASGNGRYVGASDAGALRDVFRGLAYATVWERARVDGSFPFALFGGVLVLTTFLTGLVMGRFP